MKTFSIREALREAWKIVRARIWLYAGTTLVINIVSFGLEKLADSSAALVSILAGIASFVFWIIVGIGSVNLILKDMRKEPVTYHDLFVSRGMLATYIKACLRLLLILLPFIIAIIILMFISGMYFMDSLFAGGISTPGLLAALGILVVMIPAIYVGARYYFFPYLIVEENANAKVSLSRSKEITKGAILKLLIYGFVAGLLNVVGAITYVGLLITLPLTMVATAVIYKKLKNRGQAAPEVAPVEQVSSSITNSTTVPDAPSVETPIKE